MITREEAIKRIDEQYKICEEFYYLSASPEKDYPGVMSYMEALAVAISVLRPVSREQVERMFLGCDFCKIELDDFPYIVAHSDYSSSDTCYEPSFCPICGKPLTDEAVQMVMERLEALHETVE